MRLAVVAGPVALSMLVALSLTRADSLRVTGDEPHYLVMADGLVHDRSFDLRNAYTREGQTQKIYGSPLPAPHVVIVNHRWGPYHEPGLPMLLAIPYAIGGTIGARVALCFYAGLLPLLAFDFLRRRTSASSAAWLAAGLAIGVPVSFGASQIYPDLFAGVMALALFFWLLDAPLEDATTARWALFWLLTGLLPWLNAKYLATTGALTVAALARLMPYDRRRHRQPALTAIGLVAAGPLALAAFHQWFFQNPLGPRGAAELTNSFGRAAMMFLGLHLDQGQGMFWQQPLLLAGVAALVPFARRHPRLAILWLVTYASLIVPNSMELARYGGGAPAGRFAWSAAWLWIVPIGTALKDEPRTERFVKPVVIVCLIYQLLLAVRWFRDPSVLFPRLEEDLAARNSLFPLALRPLLPSFYFWDFSSYWTYLPNVVAYTAVLALMIGGAWLIDMRNSAPPVGGVML